MNNEQTVLSYSGGLALSYKVNRRLSIQSGLYYSAIGKELSGIIAYSGFENHFYTKGSPNFTVLTSNGNVYTSNNDIFLTDGLSADRIQTNYNNNIFDPVKSELNYLDNPVHQNFSYLELPVVLRYKVVDRTLDFNLIGGVSSNLLVNNSVNAGKTQIGTTDGMNLITFSSSIGMGMEYNFSNNLSLNLEPTFRYYINPFSNIPGMRIHPYSFGVFSGISYKF
jgi:opacity protein-like surface antigen